MTPSLSSLLLLAAASLSSCRALIPPWAPTWNMSLSTAFMPCKATGVGPVPFDPHVAAKWGLADTDWSNGRYWYSQQHPQNCEETLLAQAQANHALNPLGHQMVYRNAIKGLPWFTSVREKLQDQAYWGWFLPYKGCRDYSCGPNATQNLYHDSELTPKGDCGLGVECGEYLFDLRNESCREWLRGDYILGPTGMGDPTGSVQGWYFDDQWNSAGPSEEDPRAVAACGLTPSDVADLSAAFKLSFWEKINATIAAGGFVFDQLLSPAPFNLSSAPAQCAPFLRSTCGPKGLPQSSAFLLQFSRNNHTAPWPLPYPLQDIASFLLVRGDHSFIGYAWAGCFDEQTYERPQELDWDYGLPLNLCSETAPGSGIFTRNYTRADVQMDCNSFVPTVTMK